MREDESNQFISDASDRLQQKAEAARKKQEEAAQKQRELREKLSRDKEKPANLSAYDVMLTRRGDASKRAEEGPWCTVACREKREREADEAAASEEEAAAEEEAAPTAPPIEHLVQCGYIPCARGHEDSQCDPQCGKRLHPACCQQWVHNDARCSGYSRNAIANDDYSDECLFKDRNGTTKRRKVFVCKECKGKNKFERCLVHMHGEVDLDRKLDLKVSYVWP